MVRLTLVCNKCGVDGKPSVVEHEDCPCGGRYERREVTMGYEKHGSGTGSGRPASTGITMAKRKTAGFKRG